MKTSMLFAALFSSFIIANGQSGLVADFPFNGNANDAFGNNNGVVSEALLTTDRFGVANSAYEFDGVNDVINIAHSADLNVDNELSISVWIKPSAFPASGDVMVLGKSNYSSNTNYLIRVKPSGYLQFEYKTFANTSDNPLVLNQWNHVVVTSNSASEKQVYVNNVSATHSSGYSPFGLVSDPLTIGGASYGREYFKGSIDDVKIYKSVLSATEIDKLYNASVTQIGSISKKDICFQIINSTLIFDVNQVLSEIKSVSVFDITGSKVLFIQKVMNPIRFDMLKDGVYLVIVEQWNACDTKLKFAVK